MGLVAPGAGARQEDAARKAVIEKSDTLKAEMPEVFYSGHFEDSARLQSTGTGLNLVLGSNWAGPRPRQCTACHAGAVGNLGAAPRDDHHQWVFEASVRFQRGPESRALGLTAGKLAEPLRAQLKVPADRGVMLDAVDPDGPATAAGLRAGDILLTLDSQPLAAEADLPARLAALRSKTARLAILRGGKPLAITVGGRSLATFAPAETPKVPDYYVGLETRPVDDALRAHLPSLPAGVGLLVEAPTPDGPAARAGVKTNDILLKAGEAPLPDVDALRAAIKAVGGKPLAFKLLRGGAESVVAVTPEVRKLNAALAGDVATPLNAMRHFQKLDSAVIDQDTDPNLEWFMAIPGTALLSPAPPPTGLDKRLDALDAELKALRAAIDELRKAGAGK